MEYRKAALMVKSPAHCWEGLRTALGLAMDGKEISLLLLADEPHLPQGTSRDDFVETMEMLAEDMEGRVLAMNDAWLGWYGQVEITNIAGLSSVMNDSEIIIPFGE